MKRHLVILCFIHLTSNLFAAYRPFDVYRAGSRALGAGGTGVSNIDSIGSVQQNPAFLAEVISWRFALGSDAQTRITRIQNSFQLRAQFLPIIAAAMPVGDNYGLGIMFHTPFQRKFLQEDYIYYNTEIGFGFPITRHLSAGVTAGIGVGLQNIFDGYGFTYSLGLLYKTNAFDAGLFVKPGATLNYATFSTGKSLEERLPDFFKAGISKRLKSVRLTFELEYVNWEGSTYIEAGVNARPAVFQSHFFGRVHPHFGASFDLPWFPGLQFRTGIMTEDFFDFNGINNRQVLMTFGLGGLGSRSVLGSQLRIDFSLVDSFIPSLIWNEANNIEKMQVTFELIL